jgi:hypothetical protein
VNPANQYRAKAFEFLSLAQNTNDPERRADLLRFARMWMSLTQPIGDLPRHKSPYEKHNESSPAQPVRPLRHGQQRLGVGSRTAITTATMAHSRMARR